MGVPRYVGIPKDCLSCSLRTNGDFCNLPPTPMAAFSAIGHLTLYPPNSVLLTEGHIPRGIYVLCSGRAKLSVESKDGKIVILKIASNRHVLGLSAVIFGGPSVITVTTIEYCQVKFVERESFLRFIEHDSSAAMACAAMLGRELTSSFSDVHELLLARSSTEKLARLLLSWVATEPRNRELRVASEFTHEEMAQMIGSSRETVTRLLSDLKRKDLIRLEGATLVIPNRIALQAMTS
jgi:CRP/FNR family transcriptional regulator, cyclic AMP receptor protein